MLGYRDVEGDPGSVAARELDVVVQVASPKLERLALAGHHLGAGPRASGDLRVLGINGAGSPSHCPWFQSVGAFRLGDVDAVYR